MENRPGARNRRKPADRTPGRCISNGSTDTPSVSTADSASLSLFSDLDVPSGPWVLEEPFWNQGRQWVAGVDEAGRGPLAGPVVAAAVIPNPALDFSFVRDSKKMRPEERERAYWLILGRSHAVGLGWATAGEIDRINILKASLLAMARAVQTLAPAAQVLLVDGPFPTPLDLVQKPIKKGDDLSRSIGAASIVAKVTRDRIMTALDRLYPGYGLARHKGYGTRDHMDVLARLGPTPIHRLTFKGVVP